ncbi:hypothetical protein [Wenjunlia tyrosinilytica]|uniref:hypothetical protein n=1 Tax=Wenjunlia tyrosinilytica TaxID=1544741 RepID=UPI001E529598|nr:hypothetical protein [Wenjunlia tyrosinilytica]
MPGPPRCATASGRSSPPPAPAASILVFEPSGTPAVGDRHDEIPDHVDATTGHTLAALDPH